MYIKKRTYLERKNEDLRRRIRRFLCSSSYIEMIVCQRCGSCRKYFGRGKYAICRNCNTKVKVGKGVYNKSISVLKVENAALKLFLNDVKDKLFIEDRISPEDLKGGYCGYCDYSWEGKLPYCPICHTRPRDFGKKTVLENPKLYRVYRLIRDNQPISRSDLLRRSNLTSQQLDELLLELFDEKIIDGKKVVRKSGKKPKYTYFLKK